MTVTSARPTTKYLGKFRGTVVNPIDPLGIGRIQVSVADVAPGVSSWAMPCVPLAGPNTGVFTVPPVGSGVWVEYEHGDPEHPIWVGGYWGVAAEVPALARTVPPGVSGVCLQTTLGNGVVISDVPGPAGGIRLSTATGAVISVSDTGIVISNGKGATISLTGPTTDVNLGALTVV